MGEEGARSGAPNRGPRWSLHGSTALVIGGCRGIGGAVVEELAWLGARVHTCFRDETDRARCQERWEAIRCQERREAMRLKVTASVFDLSSPLERKTLMEEVALAFNKKLDILVNNVGTVIYKPTLDYTPDELSSMATKRKSAFHMCRLSRRLLQASEAGSIVFISSVAGLSHFTGAPISSETEEMKEGTRKFACEWVKDKIRVNCVAPAVIKARPAAIVESQIVENEALEERSPYRTHLEEAMSLVTFFCLPAASYLTGQIFTIDPIYSGEPEGEENPSET